MEVTRIRELTQVSVSSGVEMEVTRIRELTHCLIFLMFLSSAGRNGSYPNKGIDTFPYTSGN